MKKKQQKLLMTIAIILLIVWVMYRMLKGKDRVIMPDAFAGTGNDPIPYDDFETGFDLGDSGTIDNGIPLDDSDLVLSDDLDNGNTPMPTYACCDPDSLSYDAQCLSNPYCYCDSQGCMYPDDSNSNYGARSY